MQPDVKKLFSSLELERDDSSKAAIDKIRIDA